MSSLPGFADNQSAPRSRPLGENARLGHYRLERRLGMGGMGVVYAAVDERVGHRVAVKVLLHAHPRAIGSFKREFRSLADLHHPNLVVLNELAVVDDQWLLSMELVEGSDFLTHVRDDEQKLRHSLRQLADGLGALHAAGKVHRDIKPSNVMVTEAGRVVLLDFGLATEVTRPQTEPGRYVMGTIEYIAPERVVVRGKLTQAADWYGVGVMLYRALAGQLPFDGERYDILHRKMEDDPTPPDQLRANVAPDLSALAMALLRRDPKRRAGRDEVIAVVGGQSVSREIRIAQPRSVLFGRERHMDVLDDAVGSVRSGRPVVVTVNGESGIGKTSLVEAFVSAADRASDTLVLRGRCFAREDVPYKGMDTLIENLTRHLLRLPAARARRLVRGADLELAARLFPTLARLEAVDQSEDELVLQAEAPRIRSQAFAAVRALFHRLSIGRLVILVLDDLQWIDTDGAELLFELLRGRDAPRIMVILSYRADEESARAPMQTLLRQLQGAGHTIGVPHAHLPELREIALGPLSPSEAETAARSILRGTDIDAAALVRNCGGNPFFLTELARHARQQPELAPAPSLDDLISSRVATLPDDARAILEVVSVAGHPIPITAAIEAADADCADASALSVLGSANFLRYRTSDGVEAVECYHNRIREAVVSMVPEPIKRLYHQRIARALERSSRSDTQLLAIHYRAAADTERAAHYTVLAAEQSARALAFGRAAELYGVALGLAPGNTERIELLRRRGDALASGGQGLDAARAYQEAAAHTGGDEALELRRCAADQLLRSGRTREGIAAFKSVFRQLGLQIAPTTRRALVRGMRRRAFLRVRGLEFHRADGKLDPRAVTRVDTLYSTASGLAMTDPMRAMDVQAQHCLHALRLGEPYRAARAVASHAASYFARGTTHLALAQKVIRVADELATQSGHPHAIALLGLVRGWGAFAIGQWLEARNRLLDVEQQLLDCPGASWELATCRFFLSTALSRIGDYNELARRLPAWVEDARQRKDIHALANLRMSLAYAHLAADNPEDGRETVEAAAALWRRADVSITKYRELFMLAQVHLYEGRVDRALEALDETWPTLRKTMLTRVQEVRISVRSLRGQACASLARAENGKRRARLIKRAMADANKLLAEGAGWAHPLGEKIVAQVALLRGDRERARQRLEHAATQFDRCHMAGHAAAARMVLGRIIGDREGVELRIAAAATMKHLGVAHTDRFTRWRAWDR